MLHKSNSPQGDPRCFAPSHSNERFRATAETGSTQSCLKVAVDHRLQNEQSIKGVMQISSK